MIQLSLPGWWCNSWVYVFNASSKGELVCLGTNDTQVMIRDQLFSELWYEKKKCLCQPAKRQIFADEAFQFLFVIFNVFEL